MNAWSRVCMCTKSLRMSINCNKWNLIWLMRQTQKSELFQYRLKSGLHTLPHAHIFICTVSKKEYKTRFYFCNIWFYSIQKSLNDCIFLKMPTIKNKSLVWKIVKLTLLSGFYIERNRKLIDKREITCRLWNTFAMPVFPGMIINKSTEIEKKKLK